MKAGLTGHQNLGSSETIAWIAASLKNIIDQYHIQHGFTSLAIGADQLYALILYDKGIPYTAVIPCEEYEKTFQNQHDLKTYRRLLQNAAEIVNLDFVKPEEIAFFEAGKQVVDFSDFVVAVWNGQPAKGLGGTGDIVKYALSKSKLVVHVNPVTERISEK